MTSRADSRGRRATGPALALAAGLAAAALTPAAASAHVTVSPPFAEAGVETQVTFDTPNERAPHATTGLEIEAPSGVEIAAAEAPHGWVLAVSDGTARWTRGRIEGTDTVRFALGVTARTRAGAIAFRAVQTYDDGEQVRWEAPFTVLPASGEAAPSQHLERALVAAVVGALVVAASLLALRRVRRRPLHTE